MGTNKTGRRVVICSNRIFKAQATVLQSYLKDQGISTSILSVEDAEGNEITAQISDEQKMRAFNAYFRKIQNARTWAILVVNGTKYGIDGYIGPMMFASCAVAFAQRKQIYLLNGLPYKNGKQTVFTEELRAWRAVNLHGSLTRLIAEFRRLPHRKQARNGGHQHFS